MSCAGDVNGDGMSDVLVGAPGVNGGAGVAYLLFSNRKVLIFLLFKIFSCMS